MLINIAINLLWIALGILVLGVVVYFLMRVISLWWGPLDARIVQTVWLAFAILCAIAILTVFATGGGGITARPFFIR